MKIAIIYHQFPHYRAAVLRALALSEAYEYHFFASKVDFEGVKAFQGDELVRINEIEVAAKGRGFRIRGWWRIISSPYSALIILGNPNIAATWWMAIAGRITGKKVIFWTHGWLRIEGSLKRFLRLAYYSLANSVMVYGERSKRLGVESGYPADRIEVIYNSLDFEKSSEVFRRLVIGGGANPRSFFGEPDRPLIICTARLTPTCSFDVLINAASVLGSRGFPVNIILVGDGASREPLAALAKERGVEVHFYGACYDEDILGGLIYAADATVSPGKIGLTAMHSLTYGTPCFTHGDMDFQMPEVEAIIPGITGDFFERGSAESLADVLGRWLGTAHDRSSIRHLCREVIATKWNSTMQKDCIEDVLNSQLDRTK